MHPRTEPPLQHANTHANICISMASIYCVDKPVRNQNICPDDNLEPNRIIHVALVQKDVTLSGINAQAMVTALLAAELDCTAFIIRNTNGALAAPTQTEGNGRGRQVNRILANSFEMSLIDFESIQNVPFWNALESDPLSYYLVFFTSNYMFIVRKDLTIVGNPLVITNDINTFLEGTPIIRWSQKGSPVPMKVDTTVLDVAPQLFDSEDTDFVNQAGSLAVIDNANGTITAPTGTAITVNLVPSPAIEADSVELRAGTLPNGLTLQVKPTEDGAQITGTPSQVGAFEVSIVIANACGISAVKNVVFEIEAP